MTTYYKILRPVEPADLDTSPGIAEVLGMIPHEGYVTFEHFKSAGKSKAENGIRYARSHKILQRVSPYGRVLELDSVKFWCTQLNESGHKNSKTEQGTRKLYLNGLSKFNTWMPGRPFPSHKTVICDGQITRPAVTKSFANVEELMEYCHESDHGTKTAQRVIREYLPELQAGKMSASAQAVIQSAIKSYFGVHDIVLDLPRTRKKRLDPVSDEDSYMTLEDFYRMLQKGKPGIMMHTIMLIQLQSGMDVSTLTYRFNYEGYSQIVKYFKTENHKSWNLEMCPVPIKLVRVKTNVQYTTFLEHDAVSQLQEYLTWKETKYGKQDIAKPLFMTKQNTPIHSKWLSSNFSEVAVRAGMQEKVSPMVYKMRAHSVRHLLKSTLKTYGCASYAADHVLGHAPRDSYEKQAILYPENLRAEYAKASSHLNIFSKVESVLNTAKDPASQDARIRELEAQVAGTSTVNAEIALLERRHRESMQKMYDAIESLNEKINSLQQHDTVKDD